MSRRKCVGRRSCSPLTITPTLSGCAAAWLLFLLAPVGAIGTVLHRCADTAICQDDVANVQLSARPVTPSIIIIAFANGLAVEVSGGLEPLVRGTREPLLRRGCHVRKGSAANAQDGVGIPKVESRVQTQHPLPSSSWTALCAAMQNRNPGSEGIVTLQDRSHRDLLLLIKLQTHLLIDLDGLVTLGLRCHEQAIDIASSDDHGRRPVALSR